MKVLLYWHDIYLPYSEYLIRAFAADSRISQLSIVGPREYQADSIYAGSNTLDGFPEHVSFEKIRTYPFRKKWAPITGLKRCIKQHSPDCIIVVDEAFSVNTLNMGIANKFAGNNGKVFFYSFENIYQTPPFRFLRERFSIKNIFVFIRKTLRYCLLDFLLQGIRAKVVHGGLACYQESVDVVHQFGWNPLVNVQWWGLDLTPFLNASEHATINLAPLSNAEDGSLVSSKKTKLIAYVGRMIQDKGVLDLIPLMQKLDTSYELLIVGSGPLESELKALVRESGLEERIRFLPPQTRDELAQLYSTVNLLILPSRTDYFWKEQYGRVLVEAMACGTPVIGSQSGAIPVVIGNPDRCFPEGDVDRMAAVVRSIFMQSQGNEERRQLQSRSMLGAADQFVNAYINLYSELSNKES
jgi:glycosyltransferase involved in cell wall biosynthesis